jgi:GTP-binding protein
MAEAKFIKTAVFAKDYPILRDVKERILPEIAVVGRSNVGKSSLLNDLFKSKGLVKTSTTPGKTQALNFFTWQDEIAFADLPGYGYAAVPPHIRKQWGPMVQAYLNQRTSLKLILFLLDIRRIPNEDDFQFLNWALRSQKDLILVLTKVDKVNQSERLKQTKHILETLQLANLHYVHYSVLKKMGRKELWAMIKEALQDESESCPI